MSGGGPIPVSGSHFSSGQLPLTVNGCFSSCSARVDGFFAGPAAERAGVGYRISDSPNQVVGAAAFKKP